MDVFEAINSRHSVRGYTNEPVPDELLEQVLEAGRRAPTASNKQPLRILVLHTAGREEELSRIYRPAWFVQAPILLAVVPVPDAAWHSTEGRSYADIDAAIVMDHMVLAATALGLGTCWVAAFDRAAAREVLGLPDDLDPIAFTPLGHSSVTPGSSARRPLEKLVKYERW